MPIDPKKTFNQTKSKIRTLWEIAMRLIAQYEDFDDRLKDLEKKTSDISKKLTSTVESNITQG
jgi:chromosome segregation ATPase